jgi:hypothetical protein
MHHKSENVRLRLLNVTNTKSHTLQSQFHDCIIDELIGVQATIIGKANGYRTEARFRVCHNAGIY